MSSFYIYPVVEYRSDDPSWVLWRVKHDGKDYLMAYSNDRLKEVYFVGEKIPHYFMSCRADDPYHISHYYTDPQTHEVRRYEQGEMNRVYHDNRQGYMWCNTHGYTQKLFTTEQPNITKLWRDLENFLRVFNLTGIKIEKPEYVR